MARISGVEVPNKRSEIALTYIYGLGRSNSKKLLTKLNIDFNKKINDLSEVELNKIRDEIEKNYIVEGDLKNKVVSSIKRLIQINCYRGIRHRRGLPVRGQKTKTNAKTRKGKGKTIANKK